MQDIAIVYSLTAANKLQIAWPGSGSALLNVSAWSLELEAGKSSRNNHSVNQSTWLKTNEVEPWFYMQTNCKGDWIEIDRHIRTYACGAFCGWLTIMDTRGKQGGGYFHLKVGGPKAAVFLVTLLWTGVGGCCGSPLLLDTINVGQKLGDRITPLPPPPWQE